MSFKDELEKLLPKEAPCDIHETYDRCPIESALTSIINLVDKEVIGEDDEILGVRGEVSSRVIEEIQYKIDGINALRAEQRAKLKEDK